MTSVWFGPPGALVELPDPDPGVSATRDLEIATHAGIGGVRTMDSTGLGWRSWTYTYEALTAEEADMIDAYHAGVHGPPPFVLLDPTAPNRFTVNQSSAGKATGTAEGFSVTAPDVVTVVRQASVIGSASLAWVASAGGSRLLNMPSRWTPPAGGSLGPSPAPPVGSSVYLSAWVKSAAPVPLSWRARWYTADGTALPAVSADPVTPPPDVWTAIAATMTVPDGAAWVSPCLVADTTTATDPTVIAVDALSMGYGSPLPAWRPGAGVPQVVITAWSTRVPYIGTVNASVQLTEVG